LTCACRMVYRQRSAEAVTTCIELDRQWVAKNS
jgi:hypothetical protein